MEPADVEEREVLVLDLSTILSRRRGSASEARGGSVSKRSNPRASERVFIDRSLAQDRLQEVVGQKLEEAGPNKIGETPVRPNAREAKHCERVVERLCGIAAPDAQHAAGNEGIRRLEECAADRHLSRIESELLHGGAMRDIEALPPGCFLDELGPTGIELQPSRDEGPLRLRPGFLQAFAKLGLFVETEA